MEYVQRGDAGKGCILDVAVIVPTREGRGRAVRKGITRTW